MCYGLRDVKQAAAVAILEGRKHPKYYYGYNAGKSYKEDWFYVLDEFFETTGGAELWCMRVGLQGLTGLGLWKGRGGSGVTLEYGT